MPLAILACKQVGYASIHTGTCPLGLHAFAYFPLGSSLLRILKLLRTSALLQTPSMTDIHAICLESNLDIIRESERMMMQDSGTFDTVQSRSFISECQMHKMLFTLQASN